MTRVGSFMLIFLLLACAMPKKYSYRDDFKGLGGVIVGIQSDRRLKSLTVKSKDSNTVIALDAQQGISEFSSESVRYYLAHLQPGEYVLYSYSSRVNSATEITEKFGSKSIHFTVVANQYEYLGDIKIDKASAFFNREMYLGADYESLKSLLGDYAYKLPTFKKVMRDSAKYMHDFNH